MQHQDQMMPGELQHQALGNDAMRLQNKGAEMQMPFTAKDLARRDALGELGVQHANTAEGAFPGELADAGARRGAELEGLKNKNAWDPVMAGLAYGRESEGLDAEQTKDSFLPQAMHLELAGKAASLGKTMYPQGGEPDYFNKDIMSSDPYASLSHDTSVAADAAAKAKSHDFVTHLITNPGAAQDPTFVKAFSLAAPTIAPRVLEQARTQLQNKINGPVAEGDYAGAMNKATIQPPQPQAPSAWDAFMRSMGTGSMMQ